MNVWLQLALAAALVAVASLAALLCDRHHEACQPEESDEPHP